MLNQQEIWKDIQGFEGMYQVSNLGSIRSIIKKPFLAMVLAKDKTGYLSVQFSVKGKKYRHRVHRLVALSFIDNVYGSPVINHKDGDKRNNRVNNLEWTTYRDNAVHAMRIGLSPKGEKSSLSKLKEKDVIDIRRMWKLKQKTQGEMAEIFSIDQTTISLVVNRKTWKHIPDEYKEVTE